MDSEVVDLVQWSRSHREIFWCTHDTRTHKSTQRSQQNALTVERRLGKSTNDPAAVAAATGLSAGSARVEAVVGSARERAGELALRLLRRPEVSSGRPRLRQSAGAAPSATCSTHIDGIVHIRSPCLVSSPCLSALLQSTVKVYLLLHTRVYQSRNTGV